MVDQVDVAELTNATGLFLKGDAPMTGYVHAGAGNYRVLIHGESGLPVLLMGTDDAVYVPHDTLSAAARQVLVTALTQRGLRPTESELTMRIEGSVHQFTLWASPKYRAAQHTLVGGVWK
jgi:hypothetical protein